MLAPDDKGEETAPGAFAAAGRWSLTDGMSDLAERGIEAVGAGSYLPSSVPGPDGGGRRGRKRSRQARGVQEEAEVGVCSGTPSLLALRTSYFHGGVIGAVISLFLWRPREPCSGRCDGSCPFVVLWKTQTPY